MHKHTAPRVVNLDGEEDVHVKGGRNQQPNIQTLKPRDLLDLVVHPSVLGCSDLSEVLHTVA